MRLNGGVETHGKTKRVLIVGEFECAVLHPAERHVLVMVEQADSVVAIRKRVTEASCCDSFSGSGHRHARQTQCSVLYSAGVNNHAAVTSSGAKFSRVQI